MAKFLDLTGLEYFWTKLKAIIQALSDKVDEIDQRQYVVEAGVSNGWSYKKFSNGSFEAWYTGNAASAVNVANGSVYWSSATLSISAPFTPNSVQYVTITPFSPASQAFAVWATILSISSAFAVNYRLIATASHANSTYPIRAYMKGTCDVSQYIS